MSLHTRLLVLGTVLVAGGCASAMTRGGTDLHRPDFSKIASMKKGTACSKSYFILFKVGSELVSDAAKSAGIKTIELVEETREGFPPFFGTHCLVVYGQ